MAAGEWMVARAGVWSSWTKWYCTAWRVVMWLMPLASSQNRNAGSVNQLLLVAFTASVVSRAPLRSSALARPARAPSGESLASSPRPPARMPSMKPVGGASALPSGLASPAW